MIHPILAQAQTLQPELVGHRRWLHQHPGVGFDTGETVEYVRRELTAMGYAPVDCGQGGLAATLTGSKPGKTILLRADMDGLPMVEEADVEFASRNGNMHACGHDLHTAMLLGAARLLMDNRDALHGTVKLMFQSAEEIFRGSQAMIDAGVLNDPPVDAAVMIHVVAGMPIPAGTVIVSAPGVSAPAADYFTVNVHGKGCHGSAPQNGVDALTAAAHLLIALQEIPARELSPDTGAVLTVGSFQGGTAGNVIADSARLCGTLRSYDSETRGFVKDRLLSVSQSIAGAFRAQAEVEFGSGCPPLKNDRQLCQSFHKILVSLLGEDHALSGAALSGGTPVRGGGSEDFAYISQQVPSVMLALAAGEPARGYPYGQHHPRVKFDEDVLSTGAAVFTQIAISYLSEA